MTKTPAVVVFDVNETLSDMAPLASAFADSGLREELVRPWFAEILRDGFALTVAGGNPAFADLATDGLQSLLAQTLGQGDHQDQVNRIMGVFKNLSLHPDVAPGVTSLSESARLVTLSNGATSVAESLLTRGGVRDKFSQLLSVQDAPRWKPAREAYEYAALETGHATAQLMLVAVHPWDIHGARAAGMQTAWINRSGVSYPSYFARPDIEVEDLVELGALLSKP